MILVEGSVLDVVAVLQRWTAAFRSSIIYETNLSVAYSAGRYAQMTEPATLAAFPYWQYQRTSSARPRPMHLGWVGTTLPASDAWWSTHYPPNGWRCRCWVRPVSEAGPRRMGLSGPTPVPYAPAGNPTIGIDKGWEYNPGAAWQAGNPLPPGAAVPGVASATPPAAPAAGGGGVPGRSGATPLPRPAAPPPLGPPPGPPPGPRRFGSLAEADAQVSADQAAWRAALSPEQLGAIERYKAGFAGPVNEALRLGRLPEGELVPLLDAALARASLPYPVELWRGAWDGNRAIRGAAPGDVVPQPAYVSATLDREVGEDLAASHFGAGVLLRLLVPAGLAGMGYVHHVPREQALEWEMLLRRGLGLRVVEHGAKVTTVEVVDDDGGADG